MVAAALLWASSGAVGKALFRTGLGPFELVQVRLTLASLILAAGLAVFHRRLFRIRARDIGYFIVLGGLGMAAVQSTYFYAISKIQVAAAILLYYMGPMLIAIYAVCFWRERLTPAKTLAIALAFGGCYLVAEGYNVQVLSLNRLGVLAGLAGAVAVATYSLMAERGMHRYHPLTVLLYALAFAAVTWHILHPPFHYLVADYTRAQWGGMIYVAVFGTVIPFALYFTGISHLRATRASVTATLEPICAGVIAWLWLGETMSVPRIVGGLLIVGAIVLLQTQREQDELSPEIARESLREGSRQQSEER